MHDSCRSGNVLKSTQVPTYADNMLRYSRLECQMNSTKFHLRNAKNAFWIDQQERTGQVSIFSSDISDN